MKKYQFFFILLFIFAGTTILWSQAPDYLVMRSEFETIGNHVVDVDATDEASVGYNYAFTSGNEAGYFELRRGTGLILIAQSIPDQVGVITW